MFIYFSKLPSKKFPWKSVQGLEFLYADTYRKTSLVKLWDTLLQLFIINMPKKIRSFLEMLPGIIFSGETTEVYAKTL